MPPRWCGAIPFTCIQPCLSMMGALSFGEKQSIPKKMMSQAHQATLQTEIMNNV